MCKNVHLHNIILTNINDIINRNLKINIKNNKNIIINLSFYFINIKIYFINIKVYIHHKNKRNIKKYNFFRKTLYNISTDRHLINFIKNFKLQCL